MTLRLTEEQDAALAALAEAEGVSKNEAAVRAIVERLTATHAEQEFVAAIDDTIKRYPSTIRRLGE